MVRVGSDGPLASALGKACKGEVMLRDDIARILRADGQVAHSVNGAVKWVSRALHGTEADVLRCRKGNVQPITMVIKTRAGRKTVTIISGFETFGIDPNDLADELRRVCTASATGGSDCMGLDEADVLWSAHCRAHHPSSGCKRSWCRALRQSLSSRRWSLAACPSDGSSRISIDIVS